MSTDRDRPTDPPTWPSEERPTLVPCLACGGNNVTEMRESSESAGRFSAITCRWCLNGAMTTEQTRAWLDHQHDKKTAARGHDDGTRSGQPK